MYSNIACKTFALLFTGLIFIGSKGCDSIHSPYCSYFAPIVHQAIYKDSLSSEKDIDCNTFRYANGSLHLYTFLLPTNDNRPKPDSPPSGAPLASQVKEPPNAFVLYSQQTHTYSILPRLPLYQELNSGKVWSYINDIKAFIKDHPIQSPREIAELCSRVCGVTQMELLRRYSREELREGLSLANKEKLRSSWESSARNEGLLDQSWNTPRELAFTPTIDNYPSEAAYYPIPLSYSRFILVIPPNNPADFSLEYIITI